MASYDELDTLIGKLKRAAIDSYMASNGWYVSETRYEQTGAELDLIATVTRPGEDGEGGGDWDGANLHDWFGLTDNHDYEKAFPQIRARIDAALSGGWTWLPDPAGIAPLVESMRRANSQLAFSAVSTDGRVTGGGNLGGYLNLIVEDCGAMGGGMITTFKQDFLGQLSKAIAGHHAITVILGGALAAQQGMWEAARETVTDIVTSATDAFNKSANNGGGDWHVLLKVAGYAVAGVSIFATGGAATTLAVAGLGLTILDDSAGGDKPEAKAPGGDDYDSIMSAFEGAFPDLNTHIDAEEKTLDANFRTNLDRIRADHASYDLQRPPLIGIDDDRDLHRNSHGGYEEIKIDRVLAKEIADDLLPSVSDELNGANSDISDCASLSPLFRDSSIGMGQYGVGESYYEMQRLLSELVSDLSGEARQGGLTFSLAVDDIGRADTSAKDALEKRAEFARTIQWGDPWD